MRKKSEIVVLFLFAAGIGLLALNIAGFFLTLRSPEIYSETETGFPNDITITYPEVTEEIIRKEGETNRAFVSRINDVVNRGVCHYWEEKIDEYNLTVPPWENYFLYAFRFVLPSVYLKYEFCDADKGLERGVGLCSQQVIIESGVLERNGIETDIIGLGGHVVLRAKVSDADNVWQIADPDYGVVLPYDLDAIEKNPAIIEDFYAARGHADRRIEELVEIYGAELNVIRDSVSEYWGIFFYIERLAYLGKWLFPVFLVIPFIVRIFVRSKSKRRMHAD